MTPVSLVTGGAGFIGSHVVNELIILGHQVIVLDDLSGGTEANVNGKATLVVGSITDHQLVDQLFESYNFTYVYHLAAYAAEGLSHFIRRFNYENNIIGSINLINAAVNYKIEHFIYTSSIAVYGEGRPPYNESQHCQPKDPYGIAKYAVELDLKNAAELFGLTYTIFRPHNVYGPNQNIHDPYRNVIGIFMKKMMQNEPLPIFGDGLQKRAFTYIDDVAPYIARCIDFSAAKNAIFNIGSEEIFTINELILRLESTADKKLTKDYLLAREEVKEAYADHSKFKNVFKTGKDTSLKVGLRKMYNWAYQNAQPSASKNVPIEIRKNLPDSWS